MRPFLHMSRIVRSSVIQASNAVPATHHMRVDYSMFEGFRVRSNARDVYSRGELIVSGGEFIGRPGRGNYLRREARGGV